MSLKCQQQVKAVFLIMTISSCVFVFVNYNETMMDYYKKMEFTATLNKEQIEQLLNEKYQVESAMKKLRKSDEAAYNNLMSIDVVNTAESKLVEMFYYFVTVANQGTCRTTKKLGGVWVKSLKALDGDKVLCMDKIMRSNGSCLIYSFGINNEWSFEDLIEQFGCQVFAYDHTISAPENRGKKIKFFKVGMGTSEKSDMNTLKNLITKNNHVNKTIDLLKVDIEGAELDTLPQWIEDGSLEFVDQIAMELHTPDLHHPPRFRWLLAMFQALYRMNFRLISYLPNTTAGKVQSADYYYAYFEIVLMKDNEFKYLDYENKVRPSRTTNAKEEGYYDEDDEEEYSDDEEVH